MINLFSVSIIYLLEYCYSLGISMWHTHLPYCIVGFFHILLVKSLQVSLSVRTRYRIKAKPKVVRITSCVRFVCDHSSIIRMPLVDPAQLKLMRDCSFSKNAMWEDCVGNRIVGHCFIPAVDN